MKKISRNQFFTTSLASLAGLAVSDPLLASLKLVDEINSPLDFYPNRDWEKIYRNQFS